MIIGRHVLENLREIFALSEDQKTSLVLGGLFIIMLIASLSFSFLLDTIIIKHNLTWRKVARPFAFWLLMAIAFIESLQLALQKRGFKAHFMTRVAEVNYIAFWRNEQD